MGFELWIRIVQMGVWKRKKSSFFYLESNTGEVVSEDVIGDSGDFVI